ncbi:MAG: manganese efflux pump [Candidatus Aminicenantes bacterium]|nr:manganese efflux pump [Candidatus Aminicenantes bacterium]
MAMDTFAVAVGVSLVQRGCTPAQTVRMAGSFGLFQFVMPIIGWAAGRTVVDLIRDYDHWGAAGLLVFVAGRMMFEAFEKKKDGEKAAACPDQTRGGRLLLLSLATSIDALAIGLSLAALNVPVIFPAAVIGGVTFVVSAVGTRIGPLLGRWAGRGAEIAGALVLLAIAAKILVEHLTG